AERGGVGFAFFWLILFFSFWIGAGLRRGSRKRQVLVGATLLERGGKGVLGVYATAGAFASQAYLDEYWCIIFIFDAARRLVAKEVVVPAGNFAAEPWIRPRVPQQTIGGGGIVARSVEHHE